MARLRTTVQARRRHAALLALLVTLVGVFVLVPSATAVHDLGLFQLDGNAVGGSPGGPNDWNNIFPPPGNTTTATATSFTTDVFNSSTDNVLTGGGTKDDLNINGGPGNGWLCKRGGAVDKNDIEHAFAAAYEGPDGSDPGTDPDVIIYFGADKFSVSGDAQIGFWLFQDEAVGCNPPGAQATAFTGTHEVGDILILSDFTNGGNVSTIRAFEWVGSGGNVNNTLQSIGESEDCDTVGAGDDLCAQVNPVGNETTGGWTYQQKNNLIGPPPEADSGKYPKGAFYEGGVNLSELLEGNVGCFTNFMAETRQSQSVDSVLEDYALGLFDTCRAEIETTPSSASIELGQSITDSAEIEGFGIGAPPPTGTVNFFVCGPLQAGELCTSGGTAIGSVDLSGNTNNPVTVLSDTFTPTAVGRYCFRAELVDDPNYDDGAVDSRETECFIVRDVSSITTAQSWLPQDSATVTLGSGGTPSGTVVFSLYENGTCSGTASATFTDTAIPYETNNLTYRTSSTIISWSATFTPSDPGVVGSTTTRCERSDLTINNSASDFPPPTP